MPDVPYRPTVTPELIVVGATPAAAGMARKRAAVLLLELGLSDPDGSVELVVSELVTNAMTAARNACNGQAPLLAHRVRPYGPAAVLIEVLDNAVGELPESQQPDEGDESGRGLPLVNHLSEGNCGWNRLGGDWAGWKVVWAIVEVTRIPAATAALSA